MELEQIGWNDWFEQKRIENCATQQQPARIIVVDRDRYIVRNEQGDCSATLTGKFRFAAESEAEYPCVGDWVCSQSHGSSDVVTIHGVLPRQSFLRRKAAGKNIDYQMIAANIDVALIVQSCHFDFNVRRLERYLVMVREGHIEPILILSKTDLVTQDELEHLIARIHDMGIGIRIIPLSNVDGSGVDQVRELMLAKKTYCLLGSSGVGKTSLINRLSDNVDLLTKSVSVTGEGRHTTVRRQLIELEQGALLVDTPGMRELGILGASDAIDDSYADIGTLSSRCRFKNCSHTSEPGCALLEALENGTLDREHYNNFVKISKESDFYEMSYVEKKKKDKKFGRMVRSVMKDKDRYR